MRLAPAARMQRTRAAPLRRPRPRGCGPKENQSQRIESQDLTRVPPPSPLAGGGPAINKWLEENGYKDTRVNSRTPGREANRSKFGWGQTTPKEMAELLVKIREGKVISPRASERIYRNLIRIYWDSQALSQIPPFVQVASKSGAVDQSRSEVVLVNAPHGDYVFCVITKNQKDESWNSTNEGFTIVRKVSEILWNYFEQIQTKAGQRA